MSVQVMFGFLHKCATYWKLSKLDCNNTTKPWLEVIKTPALQARPRFKTSRLLKKLSLNMKSETLKQAERKLYHQKTFKMAYSGVGVPVKKYLFLQKIKLLIQCFMSKSAAMLLAGCPWMSHHVNPETTMLWAVWPVLYQWKWLYTRKGTRFSQKRTGMTVCTSDRTCVPASVITPMLSFVEMLIVLEGCTEKSLFYFFYFKLCPRKKSFRNAFVMEDHSVVRLYVSYFFIFLCSGFFSSSTDVASIFPSLMFARSYCLRLIYNSPSCLHLTVLSLIFPPLLQIHALSPYLSPYTEPSSSGTPLPSLTVSQQTLWMALFSRG